MREVGGGGVATGEAGDRRSPTGRAGGASARFRAARLRAAPAEPAAVAASTAQAPVAAPAAPRAPQPAADNKAIPSDSSGHVSLLYDALTRPPPPVATPPPPPPRARWYTPTQDSRPQPPGSRARWAHRPRRRAPRRAQSRQARRLHRGRARRRLGMAADGEARRCHSRALQRRTRGLSRTSHTGCHSIERVRVRARHRGHAGAQSTLTSALGRERATRSAALQRQPRTYRPRPTERRELIQRRGPVYTQCELWSEQVRHVRCARHPVCAAHDEPHVAKDVAPPRAEARGWLLRAAAVAASPLPRGRSRARAPSYAGYRTTRARCARLRGHGWHLTPYQCPNAQKLGARSSARCGAKSWIRLK